MDSIPIIPTPPADYPWIISLLVAMLGILLFFGWKGIQKLGGFLEGLLDKLEKRADDERARADAERARADKQHEQSLELYRSGEKSKQERGDRLDAKIDASNAELSKLIVDTHNETGARLAAAEASDIHHHHRLLRLEEKSGIHPASQDIN